MLDLVVFSLVDQLQDFEDFVAFHGLQQVEFLENDHFRPCTSFEASENELVKGLGTLFTDAFNLEVPQVREEWQKLEDLPPLEMLT